MILFLAGDDFGRFRKVAEKIKVRSWDSSSDFRERLIRKSTLDESRDISLIGTPATPAMKDPIYNSAWSMDNSHADACVHE